MLSNADLPAKFRFDTAENFPPLKLPKPTSHPAKPGLFEVNGVPAGSSGKSLMSQQVDIWIEVAEAEVPSA